MATKSKCPKCEGASLEICFEDVPVCVAPGAPAMVGPTGHPLRHTHGVHIALLRCASCHAVISGLPGTP